ncbi:DUF3955 domain-containing protein [Tissierella sp. MB52-C2]|uniref:DUF3955 domain-containing protein n=1 Tax=Tissierella sp. MB52-C2 TaxID=3070999 RepID=UPI00280AF02F|nr:DUF3955 domain-containing protein [Tissierella sp. MB52-C2]WMM23584.1 DUF3955 domain-containing protein [Tissierella sp. MB52-C2]
MDFGEQLRKIRTDRGLTQEQVASKLNVSRQTISNWENNKNLPDLEMVVDISMTFNLSLDQLILGGENMNNMTEKLIKDGSETRRAKMNLISIIFGAVLLCIGVACILIKANSVEYIDAEGFLHENFFLLPIGFFFIFSGFVTFIVTGVRNIVENLKNRKIQ